MLTPQIGRTKHRRNSRAMKRILQYVAGLVVFLLIALLIVKKSSYNIPLDVDFLPVKANKVPQTKLEVGPCSVKNCPAGMFSFSIFSGAANIVYPKICVENKLILGTIKNNAGSGINTVVLNGGTGEVIKVEIFNMYNGEVQPLIEFLHSLERGNILLMATSDEAATKLNDEARNLITELGSTKIKSLGYRDNWVFVGGKGSVTESTFEKYIKNVQETNKYEGWPEILDIEGCVPKYYE